MDPISLFLSQVIIDVGLMSKFNVNHIIQQKAFPSVYVVGKKIKNICGSSRHLGCYSGQSNLIVLKDLENKDLHDYAVFSHEIFHHVQYNNGKRHNLEPAAYRFEESYKRIIKKKLLNLELSGEKAKKYRYILINLRGSKK